jgi:hypothetical protein
MDALQRYQLALISQTNLNVAYLYLGKTGQRAPDVASRRLGQVEAYLTVREILAEASKGADGVLWREFNGFGRYRVCNVKVKSQMCSMQSIGVNFPYLRNILA